MKLTAAQLAHLLQGTLEGDPEIAVMRPARIEEAKEGDLAFLDNPKYEQFAYTTKASVLLVHRSFAPIHPIHAALIRVDDVRSSLALLLEKFQNGHSDQSAGSVSERANVHPSASIALSASVGDYSIVEAGAVIGAGSSIAAQVYIGANVQIGENCKILPGVRIMNDCIIGDNCVIHPNAVLGADGFGFAPQEDGSWKKVPHVGNVVLENEVEIGACACIDRASLGSTLIRSGVKLDNLVHIAHNVEVGKNTVLAAQSGIAGSAKLGEQVMLGGQSGVAGHITLADGTRAQAQSGLASSVKTPGQAVFGSPAIPYNDFVRAHIIFKQLPELQKQVRTLEKKLAELAGKC